MVRKWKTIRAAWMTAISMLNAVRHIYISIYLSLKIMDSSALVNVRFVRWEWSVGHSASIAFTHMVQRHNIIVNNQCSIFYIFFVSCEVFFSLFLVAFSIYNCTARTCDAVCGTQNLNQNWAPITFERTSCLFTFFSHSFRWCVFFFLFFFSLRVWMLHFIE